MDDIQTGLKQLIQHLDYIIVKISQNMDNPSELMMLSGLLELDQKALKIYAKCLALK